MSSQYFKAILEYDNNGGETEKQTFYIHENNTTDFRKVITEDGKNPSCSGTDSYCNGLAAIIELDGDERYGITMNECSWDDLPDKIQQIFNYELYKKLHPLRLKEYSDDSQIRIWRAQIHQNTDIQFWLENGMQPFDLILEDPNYNEGKPILCPPKACPICGSRNVSSTGFNELAPYALAGSAGYIDTCQDCGYSHREITMMS